MRQRKPFIPYNLKKKLEYTGMFFKKEKKNTSSNPAHYVLFCLYMHELQTLENSNYKTLVRFKIHIGFSQCICTD